MYFLYCRAAEDLISIFGDNEVAVPKLVEFLQTWRRLGDMGDDDFLMMAAIATVEWYV